MNVNNLNRKLIKSGNKCCKFERHDVVRIRFHIDKENESEVSFITLENGLLW